MAFILLTLFVAVLTATTCTTCFASPDHFFQSTGERAREMSHTMDVHQKASLQVSQANNIAKEMNATLYAIYQQNQLSPIVRYAGTGYNIIRGNPDGDFLRGGIDPGIRLTREVFTFSYNESKKVYFRGHSLLVPDQISFHPRSSCTAQNSEKAFSGKKSYAKELETSVSASASASVGFASFSFSMSAGMKSVKKRTEDNKSIIIQKNKQCNYGTARYMYENALGRAPGYTLSRSFKNSVLYTLPQRYSLSEYARFIEDWGTHVIMELEVGTREIQRSSATYNQVYSYLMKHKSLSTSVHASYGVFSFSSSFMLDSLNTKVNQNTKLGRQMTTITMGTRELPAPIHLSLKLLTEGLDKIWWPEHEWKRSIARKRQNLKKALHSYPKYVRAHRNTDPTIKVSPEWPGGSYALPMTVYGCPNGWSQGWRQHDDENHHNHNSKSGGIQKRMKIEGDHNYKVYFCVKTSNPLSLSSNSLPWPRGSYCIAKKEDCPDNFQEGVINWDDEDHKNGNKVWGTLPDGKYDTNTAISFCCRNDGSYTESMVLPTNKPFYLYRYGGQCQHVNGMKLHEDWIHWDNERHHNKDRCTGSVPDTTQCHKDIVLQYCYYYK